jgi:DNA-binding response OmpR family regulator
MICDDTVTRRSRGVARRVVHECTSFAKCFTSHRQVDTDAAIVAGLMDANGTEEIVVVDDDSTTGDVICAILEVEGYTARLHVDGASALASIRSNRPRLVLFDWLIRGPMGGDELFYSLRSSEDTAAIPILICTTESHLLERVPALQGDHAAVLTKPFELDELIEVVGRLIN